MDIDKAVKIAYNSDIVCKRGEAKMKVCPRCNTANMDTAVICKECGAHISAEAETVRSAIEKIEQQERVKAKRIRLLHKIFVPIGAVLYLAAYIFSVINTGFYFAMLIIALLAILFSWLSIHKPEAMFKLNHFTTIDNLDSVELSDFYLYSSKLGGIIIIAGMFILFLWMGFFLE